jgi:hypothetical protein
MVYATGTYRKENTRKPARLTVLLLCNSPIALTNLGRGRRRSEVVNPTSCVFITAGTC